MPSHNQLDLMEEGARVMRICNSCRYCEGYCAVFPAMEKRQTFLDGDLNYLANLCHNCSECYYACQYAPPHEFAVNVPKLLAEIRAKSYRTYAWPQALANRTAVWSIVTACFVLSIFYAGGVTGSGAEFYRVVPHRTMVLAFGGASLLVFVALLAGFIRFWRNSGEPLGQFLDPKALASAMGDALTLRYLDGGGGGCTYPDERQSQSRRLFHHFTFYGFALCFGSTTAAAFYHYALGWRAPYGYFSLPVVLGTLGGVGILVGTPGLLRLKWRSNPETQAGSRSGMDAAFLILLLLSSASGLLLLAMRESTAMAGLLVVHLGIVLALFLTLPYGRFVHAIYRSAALVKYALERSRVRAGWKAS